LREHFARHARRTADDQRLVRADHFGELTGRQTGFDVKADARVAPEHFETLRRERITQQDAEFFRHNDFSETSRNYALHGRDTCPRLEAISQPLEPELQRAHRDQHVERSEITHMADPHEFAFHLILATLHRDAELVAHHTD